MNNELLTFLIRAVVFLVACNLLTLVWLALYVFRNPSSTDSPEPKKFYNNINPDKYRNI